MAFGAGPHEVADLEIERTRTFRNDLNEIDAKEKEGREIEKKDEV